jgi:hypothetical protein
MIVILFKGKSGDAAHPSYERMGRLMLLKQIIEELGKSLV